MSGIGDWWAGLAAERRQRVAKWGAGAAALMIPFVGFSLRDPPPPRQDPQTENRPVVLEPDLMEVDEVSGLRVDLYERDQALANMRQENDKQIAEMRRALDSLKAMNAEAARAPVGNTLAASSPDVPPGDPLVGPPESGPRSPYPLPPGSSPSIQGWNPLLPSGQGGGQGGGQRGGQGYDRSGAAETPEPVRVFGGIASFHVAQEAPAAASAKRGVYLPPSFMQGTLLTGLHASTTEFGQANPQNVLIRIATPAILPNRIKTDLKGCFLIAHGFGALDAERVHLRLVTLSCVARSGARVIDQAVQGYVADSDGIAGLNGRVVSKMGASVARATLAGFIGGIGDAVQGASTVQSISALGQTTTTDPTDLLQSGIGSGIGTASDELTKLYLDLARQAAPVIEVGPTKQVTVVVTKGVLLDIADYKDYDREL